jgi:NADH dehydrogenase (ubiquinone) 1 alpha subcomplex subunit 2
VLNNYLGVKKDNPDFPFIVRECEGIQPYIIARYRFGVEKKAFVANLDEQEINDVVKHLVQ